MSKSKVLIQDIADALNLSRTTISKVLNNSGSVSSATRERVLQKVAELNYKNFSSLYSETLSEEENIPKESPVVSSDPTVPPSALRNIAVLFSKTVDNQHIGFSLLSVFGEEISRKNYNFSLYPIYTDNLKNLSLPTAFDPENVSGILCIEIFDADYTQLLCSLNKPILFIDAYANALCDHLHADILLMESQHHLAKLVKTIITKYHLTNVGFIGPYLHCLSFYERWLGFHHALQHCGLSFEEDSCIITPEDDLYFHPDWLLARLKRLNPLPELIVCTNDFMAFQVIAGLKSLNISVPFDTFVIGFDNIPLSAVSVPHLTTIDSHSATLGHTAATLLLSRIDHPDSPHITSHIDTEIIFRDSSKRDTYAPTVSHLF